MSPLFCGRQPYTHKNQEFSTFKTNHKIEKIEGFYVRVCGLPALGLAAIQSASALVACINRQGRVPIVAPRSTSPGLSSLGPSAFPHLINTTHTLAAAGEDYVTSPQTFFCFLVVSSHLFLLHLLHLGLDIHGIVSRAPRCSRSCRCP